MSCYQRSRCTTALMWMDMIETRDNRHRHTALIKVDTPTVFIYEGTLFLFSPFYTFLFLSTTFTNRGVFSSCQCRWFTDSLTYSGFFATNRDSESFLYS